MSPSYVRVCAPHGSPYGSPTLPIASPLLTTTSPHYPPKHLLLRTPFFSFPCSALLSISFFNTAPIKMPSFHSVLLRAVKCNWLNVGSSDHDFIKLPSLLRVLSIRGIYWSFQGPYCAVRAHGRTRVRLMNQKWNRRGGHAAYDDSICISYFCMANR